MGVVYKLKQEVIDFIISQKRLDEGLSCRKIAEIVKDKFQVDVSKSAVNTVIKQANLSSPVGRKSESSKKSQKFKIPEERKAQILTSLQENLLPAYKEEALKLPETKKDLPLVITPGQQPPKKEEIIVLSAPPKEPEQLSKEESGVNEKVEPQQEKVEEPVSLSGEKQSVAGDAKIADSVLPEVSPGDKQELPLPPIIEETALLKEKEPSVVPEESAIESREEASAEIEKKPAETPSGKTEEPASLPVPSQEEIPEQQTTPPVPLVDEKQELPTLPEKSPAVTLSSDEDKEKIEEESSREAEPSLRLMPDPLAQVESAPEEPAPTLVPEPVKEEGPEEGQKEKEQAT